MIDICAYCGEEWPSDSFETPEYELTLCSACVHEGELESEEGEQL